MIDIASTPLVVAAAGVATAGLALVLKISRSKPKRAEKWEKAAIMKQLLALSDQDPGLATAASPVRMRPPVSRPALRPSTANVKARTKTNLPAHSKAR